MKKGQRKSLERRITDSETLTYEAKKHQITDYVLEKPKVMRFRKSISKYDNICEKRVEKKSFNNSVSLLQMNICERIRKH